MNILIKNGRVIDPATGVDDKLDILVEGATIKKIAPDIIAEDVRVIDALNKIVVPGLIDVHVHFRQPGQTHKETIETGSMAAAGGGFTTVIAEPNTDPPIDTAARIRNILKMAKAESVVNFYTKACITVGSKGKRLARIEELKKAGAIAISDDGHPVFGKRLMHNAFKKACECKIQVSPHCEESDYYRERLREKKGEGLLSFSSYNRETSFIKREIELAERVGWSVHISHVSQAESVREIAGAKRRGVRVTAEAAPHHFTLTQEATANNTKTNAKVNPPLRLQKDIDAIKEGLQDGTIDAIATDHAPHAPYEKDVDWNKAPFGIIGLETALGLVLTKLVQPGILSLSDAIAKMAINPARIFGLDAGQLKIGKKADITVIDLEKEWTVKEDEFLSRSKNSPFIGWQLKGKAVLTIVGGKVVMEENSKN